MKEILLNKDENCTMTFKMYNTFDMENLNEKELMEYQEYLDLFDNEHEEFDKFGKVVISIDAEDNGYSTNAGYISGYIFEEGYKFEGNLHILDEISADLHEFGSSMFNKTINPTIVRGVVKNNLFFIDKLYVEKEFRGKGYGTFILEHIDEVMEIKIDSVILDAFPFGFSGNQTVAQNRLIEFYERNGFRKTKKIKSKKERNYMVMHI